MSQHGFDGQAQEWFAGRARELHQQGYEPEQIANSVVYNEVTEDYVRKLLGLSSPAPLGPHVRLSGLAERLALEQAA